MTIFNIIALAYLIYSIDSIIETAVAIFKREKTLKELLSCNKCFSFWIVLLWKWDLQAALLVSLCVLLMESFITTKL